MIYAVPSAVYDRLHGAGDLAAIQDEVRRGDTAALAGRVERGELVEARNAERHPRGERDRCYVCGDEVTRSDWTDKPEGPVV